MLKNLTLRKISLIFLSILTLISVLLIFDTLYFSQNISQINKAWLSYQSQHAEKARLETSLREKLGYGGMIHDFKNYILRKDFELFVRLQKSMGATQSVVNQYLALSSTQAEKLALEDIKQTLNKYQAGIKQIRTDIDNGKSSSEIDNMVKINDQFALRGMKVLRKEIISKYSYYNQAQKKPVIAAAIRSELGYGGMIHSFKNYVLRQDKKYLKQTSQSINKLMDLIDLYSRQYPTLGEETSLDDIKNTLLKYQEKLTVVSNMIKKGETAEKIDQQIRISDRLALRGLNTLEHDIILQIEVKSGSLSNKIVQVMRHQKVHTYIAVTLILLLASVLFWIFNNKIIHPVKKISQLMTELAQGNADLELPDYNTQTELGQMIKALHIFKEHEHFKKIAEEELKLLAMNDPLTGLANRNQFEKRYNEMNNLAKREGKILALLAIDLDKFKPVNDKLGHAAGDAVLKSVAEKLLFSVREIDLVARLGGDEFTVILYAPEDIAAIEVVAQRIINSVSTPIQFNDKTLSVGTSLGISIHKSTSEETLDNLMNNADMALYEAKNAGRNTYRIFEN